MSRPRKEEMNWFADRGVDPAALAPDLLAAITALHDENVRLRAELGALTQRLQTLERLADQDDLVPLSNRRSFMRVLERAIHAYGRYGTAGAILFFDLNNLKAINDSYGHAAGNAALVHVAVTLQRNLRASDVLARLGGDEFAALLLWVDLETARTKAEHLARLVADDPCPWNGKTIPISLAYGTYVFAPGETAEAALAAADREMYRCKAAQKARARAATPAVTR